MSLLLGLALFALQDGPPGFEPPALVPPAAVVQPRREPFLLPDNGRIVATQPELLGLAEVLADELETRLGRRLPTEVGAARSGDVVLSTGGSYVNNLGTEEGFAIEVYGDHVAVMGAGTPGVACGVARLLQVGDFNAQQMTAVFPAIYVQDAPRRAWRGIHCPVELDAEGGKEVLDAIILGHRLGYNRVVHAGPTWSAPEEGSPAAPEALAAALLEAERRGVQLIGRDDLAESADVLLWETSAKLPEQVGKRAIVLDLSGDAPKEEAGLARWCVSALARGESELCCEELSAAGCLVPMRGLSKQPSPFHARLAAYAWTGESPGIAPPGGERPDWSQPVGSGR